VASLYSQYVKERLGKDVIENDDGFCTIVITNDRFYIEDVFVRKEARQTGAAQDFGTQACEWAKRLGFKEVWGSVFAKANGAENSIRLLHQFGFRIFSAGQDMIWLKKEL
jgi:GNAT superfamily N-acetyltransferase